jgi:hypothetical protein
MEIASLTTDAKAKRGTTTGCERGRVSRSERVTLKPSWRSPYHGRTFTAQRGASLTNWKRVTEGNRAASTHE